MGEALLVEGYRDDLKDAKVSIDLDSKVKNDLHVDITTLKDINLTLEV